MGGVIDQFMRFGVVGVINTLLDFALFNFLVGKLGWRKIPANFVSTSVAMAFSFSANFYWVFPAQGAQTADRAVRFVVVSLVSCWIIQNAVIYLCGRPISRLMTKFALPSIGEIGVEFIHRNVLKISAVGAGFVWNFCWYRTWVFGP